MEEGGDRERLEEGLRRLRAMGYLQSPAEIYVLNRLPRRGGMLRTALAAALWLGIVGGVAVGGVLVGTALLADPSLLDRPRELMWLALDLLVAASLLGFLFVFLSSWPLLAWLRRASGPSTRSIGRWVALVAGPLLAAYLADALGRHALPAGPAAWWPPLAVLAALGAGLGGALLSLGMEGTFTLVRLRLGGGWPSGPRGRFGRALPWVLGVLVAAGVLALGPYRSLRPLPRLDELRLAAPAAAPPLLVVTFDGLALEEIHSRPGVLPALPSVGARHSALVPEAEEDPAAFWNSLATGFSAEEHGLRGMTTATPHGVEGETAPLSRNPVLDAVRRHLLPGVGLGTVQASDQRELGRPPVWEIVAHAGGDAAVVNWWASYPAVPHARLAVISDRWFGRLWVGGEMPGDEALLRQPPALDAELGESLGPGSLREAVERLRAAVPAVVRGDELLREAARAEGGSVDGLLRAWRYATAADCFHARAMETLLPSRRPRLAMLHLNGHDVLVRALRSRPDARGGELARQLLELHLELLDGLLARLSAVEEGSLLLLASSPLPEGGRRIGWTLDGAPGPEDGGDVRSWAPWLLRVVGLPPALDMRGATPPAPRSYGGRPDWSPPAGRDAADLERLRALGYIGG